MVSASERAAVYQAMGEEILNCPVCRVAFFDPDPSAGMGCAVHVEVARRLKAELDPPDDTHHA